MPTCRGKTCGAEIKFIKMRMPPAKKLWQVVDPEPTHLGNIVIEADGLGVVLGKQDAIHYTGEKWMPHWKSCPDSKAFRLGQEKK
jgi:hypothetical protein